MGGGEKCAFRLGFLVHLVLPIIVDLTPPVGATDYGLVVGVGVVDFEAETQRVVAVTGVPSAAPLDGTAVPALTIAADLGAVPGATETVVLVLGVHFFQQLNGQLYPLNNEGTTPLGVVYAG